MGLLARYREARDADELVAEATATLLETEGRIEMAETRLADLELALEDAEWIRAGLAAEEDFTTEGRAKLVRNARLMYLKNPLIRRGVNVHTYYVFGQGVEISARGEAVNEVVQDFLADPRNRAALTSSGAMAEESKNLLTQGNLFYALFANVSTGRVRIARVPPEQIVQVVCNPEDESEPWWYLRRFEQVSYNAQGVRETRTRKLAYRALDYQPNVTDRFGEYEVAKDGTQVVPLYHVKIGQVGRMKFGVPAVYSSMDWARAYKGWLEDWASISRSLSRWTWKATTGRQRPADVKQRLATTITEDTDETNPPPTTGAVFVGPKDLDFSPISKTGAQPHAEDGLQLRKFAAAGLDIPDTILGADPDMGNLATAKTLDRPTELAMLMAQTAWAGVFRDLCQYVVERAIEAPNGKLRGRVERDEGIAVLTVTGDEDETDTTIDVTFPPILEQDAGQMVGAVDKALKAMPDADPTVRQALAEVMLTALGIEDVDDLADKAFPDNADSSVGGQAPPPADDDAEGETGNPPEESREALLTAVRELRSALRVHPQPVGSPNGRS